MTAEFPRTTYERAVAGYDPAFERQLLEAITRAIFETSLCADANVMALRTGETANALLTALAVIIGLSPSATRSPTALRKTIDEFGKRLRRRVAEAESNSSVQDFARRSFRGGDVGGTA